MFSIRVLHIFLVFTLATVSSLFGVEDETKQDWMKLLEITSKENNNFKEFSKKFLDIYRKMRCESDISRLETFKSRCGNRSTELPYAFLAKQCLRFNETEKANLVLDDLIATIHFTKEYEEKFLPCWLAEEWKKKTEKHKKMKEINEIFESKNHKEICLSLNKKMKFSFDGKIINSCNDIENDVLLAFIHLYRGDELKCAEVLGRLMCSVISEREGVESLE